MNLIFADTFFFLALINPADEYHPAADTFARQDSLRMLTTPWVLAELADGMCAPVARAAAASFIRMLQSDRNVIIESDGMLFEEGLALYESRPDKFWSLTDCISFVTMQRHGVQEALTGDHHFEQAGFTCLFD